jgi:hypothetical protein
MGGWEPRKPRAPGKLTQLGSELGGERLVDAGRLDGRVPQLATTLGGLALAGAAAVAAQVAAQPRVQGAEPRETVRVRGQDLELTAQQLRRLHGVASAQARATLATRHLVEGRRPGGFQPIVLPASPPPHLCRPSDHYGNRPKDVAPWGPVQPRSILSWCANSKLRNARRSSYDAIICSALAAYFKLDKKTRLIK